MSTDLTKLIDRIADAGGPVELRDNGGRYFRIGTGMYEAGSTRPVPWGELDDAALIAALKADALKRGCGWSAGAQPETQLEAHYVVFQDYQDGKWDDIGSHGSSDHEATAWCLAWLAAFENPDADQ